MKLIVLQEHLKCWLQRLESLLWVEHKFNRGTIGLKKAEQISITIFVLIARATTDEKIEAV